MDKTITHDIKIDHEHNYSHFPDSSAIYCTKCGNQLINITKCKKAQNSEKQDEIIKYEKSLLLYILLKN